MPLREDPTYHVGGLTKKNDLTLLRGQGRLQPRRGLRGHVARRAIVGRRARFRLGLALGGITEAVECFDGESSGERWVRYRTLHVAS